MIFSKVTSPYLSDPNRLGDVIAAIQAMATYKFYKLPFDGWADRISADKTQADKWKSIFVEHPEFFRLDSEKEKASLVWRRQFPKLYDVDELQTISKSAFNSLNDTQKNRISRTPLSADDIKALVDTAVDLHTRAHEREKEGRWYVPIIIAIVSFVGSLIAVYIGAALKG